MVSPLWRTPIPTLGTLCCLNPRAFDTRHQILHWPSNVSILVLYDWNPAQHCHQILHWPSNVSILVLYDWNPAHHCHQILHWPSNVSILVLHDWNPAQHCHQILHWPSNVSILVLYDWNMLISERRQIFKRSTSKLNWWWTSKHGLVMYTCGTQELTTVTQYQLNSI